MNIAYQDVARLIWESADGWQYDDTNATTLPIAKATLVHNQQDYSIPSTAQRVERVQVKDRDGTWHKLQPLDIYDITVATEEHFENPGLPLYYDLIGMSVMLYPSPASGSVTLSAGLQMFVNRDVTELTVSATSATPGFATSFHRILSYAAALDFAQDTQQRQYLAAQKARLESGLIRFYSKRGTELKTTIKPAGKKRWRQYQ